ncbi:Tyrosine-protein kinase Fer [Trichostrongylus colubriformis]
MLVMELVDGGSLDSVLRKRKDDIPLGDLVQYAFGAAKGLEYLHENDCIHRDVAARNCLVSGTDVKISDFGLSRELSNREKKYKLKDMNQRLPIRWLAPEVLATATYSTKSDVFSYGVLLWEIYSEAAVPYHNMKLAQVQAQVLAGYRLSAPNKMPKFIRLIMEDHCFATLPDERWTMTQIRQHIEDLLEWRKTPTQQETSASK